MSLFEAKSTDSDVPKRNVACNMPAVETLVQEDREMPDQCGPFDVIVCPKRTGIWYFSTPPYDLELGAEVGDMHFYLGHVLDKSKGFKPFVLGHESSGIVSAVGSQVTRLKVGDRVAMEPGEPCYRCDECKHGYYNQCEFMKFAAAARDGTLQAFYKLPADLCYRLPDNLSLEEGAMMEPLSVAVNAVYSIAQQRPMSNVAVFGAGPVGLLTMAVAKALGARRVIAIDVNQARLDFAKQYAATDIHLASPMEQGELREDYSRRHADIITEKFGLGQRGRNGIDVVYECTGAEVCMQTGLWILKRRGLFVQIGNGPMYCSIPQFAVAMREITIKGCFRYGAGVYDNAIDLVSRGQVSLKPLLTHKYTFADIKKAFNTTRDGKSEDGKIAIKVMRPIVA